jgi:hypothetical protein
MFGETFGNRIEKKIQIQKKHITFVPDWFAYFRPAVCNNREPA